MSFSKSFHESVSYQTTVTVHYPASEHGGTVTKTVSGSIPVDINLRVDTDEYDLSVDRTVQSLGVVAGALSAAEAAQVAEVTRMGKRISDTAIRGFFQVVAGEFSMRASEFSNAMKTLTGLIMGEAERLEGIYDQMRSDYAAIKARYLKIFATLDDELNRRLAELDRDAFALRDVGLDGTVLDPYRRSAAGALTQAHDMGTASLKLTCARTKGRVASALESLGAVCAYLADYEEAVDGMGEVRGSEGDLFAPVVYAVERDIATSMERIVVHGGAMSGDDAVRRATLATIARTPDAAWDETRSQDRQAIDRAYLGMVADYDAQAPEDVDAERVRACMVALYQGTRTQTVYGR